ncbi:MAG: FHA domain-containing protein [Albidovulum sp.]
MGILSKLFGRKSHDSSPQDDIMADLHGDDAMDALDLTNSFKTKKVMLNLGEDTSSKVVAAAPKAAAPADADPVVNIWDMDNTATAVPAAPQEMSEPAARIGATPARKRRTKTRLLGFDKSDGQVVDMFNNPVAVDTSRSTRFPVGWIVVADGPGRGESFTLQAGMSPIGRGEDQVVQLDFGDSAISRTNHAAIVYDPETFQFFLGHGGKSNIVRLNGSPVISNEALKDGDLIRMGETTLRFVALCNDKFNWSNDKDEEIDNVEIA